MPEPDVMLTFRASYAIDKQLERISEETGRNKSDLIREAVVAFIGMYDNAKAGNEARRDKTL
jgi:predicted DNA-binding protein